MKSRLLSDGWFLAGYNADMHWQEPSKEKGFILQAQDENFTGMVLLATPIQPDNSELFARLRLEGMKIAHLMPYLRDMTKEAYFCADYLAAGRLAVAQAVRAGYDKVVYWREGESPDRDLNQQGIKEMAAAMGIEKLPDLPDFHWTGKAVCDYLADRGGIDPRTLQLAGQALLALPPKTCVLSQWDSMLAVGMKFLREQGISVPGKIGFLALSDFSDGQNPVSTVTFDHAAQLGAALEYVMDGHIDSVQLVQKLFPPEFKDNHTL